MMNLFMVNLRYLISLIAVGCLLTGLGVGGWQVLGYLKSGAWTPVSAIDGLVQLDSDWAMNPQTWIGLWQMLATIPLALGMIGAAFALAIFATWIQD